jgi:hypothetical protein
MVKPMRRLGVLAALAVLCGSARARAADEPHPAWMDAPNERRAGLVFGFGGGPALAQSSGYPNAATQIDQPQYYSASNTLSGFNMGPFVMGALTDYLNFGFFVAVGTYDSAHWHSTGVSGGFRIEAFPLYRQVPKLADLGLYTQLGVGSTKLHATVPGDFPDADGSQSFLGVGAFYEWTLVKMIGGHLTAGPTFEYDVTTSRPIERHGAMLGARIAFYGGM